MPFLPSRTLLMALLAVALLASHGLAPRHRHASGHAEGPPGFRAVAGCPHAGAGAHFERGPEPSETCLSCALLQEAPAAGTPSTPALVSLHAQAAPPPPARKPVRPLLASRPGRAPPTC